MLVSNPASTDPDLVNSRYPSIWSDGADIAELVYSTYGATGDERFRLYRVNQPDEPVTPINMGLAITIGGS